MLLLCREADIKADVFTHFAGYLKDYLSKCCAKDLADSLREMIGDDASPGRLVENPKDYRLAIYSSMIFDDYLLTPGPRDESNESPAESTGSFLFSSVIPDRYNRILLERLALGLGEDGQVDPPSGNDELIELISSL